MDQSFQYLELPSLELPCLCHPVPHNYAATQSHAFKGNAIENHIPVFLFRFQTTTTLVALLTPE